MPTFTGKYEYLGPGGSVVQEGSAQLSFDAETLTLSGRGAPIACDLGDIDVVESGEYELRVGLYTGHVLRLLQFAKAFQDLQSQLLEAYRDRLVKCLLVSDLAEVARFVGRVALASGRRACEGPAEIRLYESNVAVLPDAAAGFQWRLADLDEVAFDESEYAVVLRRGDKRLRVGRLAKRTGELVERLRERTSAQRERAAHVLRGLFPFLSPEQFRQAAGLMREGALASILDLRPLHRLLERSLLERAVDGALRPYLAALLSRSAGEEWLVGFKIVRTNEVPEAPDEDAAEGDETAVSREGEERPGEAEVSESRQPAAAIEVGEGLEALVWFFVPVAPRRAAGPATHAAWEASSAGGRATYVFRLPAGYDVRAAVAALNEGLVAVNFRREPIYLPADRLETDPLYRHYAIATRRVPELALVRSAFGGRALHRTMASWQTQLDDLVSR